MNRSGVFAPIAGAQSGRGKTPSVHPRGPTPSQPSENTTTNRHVYFLLSVATACALAAPPLVLFGISLRSDHYSHIPLIPLISAFLLYQRRTTVFDCPAYAPRWGLAIAAAGLLMYAAAAWSPELNRHDASSLMVFSSLAFLVGAFVWLYGVTALKRAAFPFLFLLFTVPIPSPLLEQIIYFLQAGSTEVTALIFTFTGLPYFREGFVFHLPGFSIEVATQCSGIRSSLALLVTAVLAAHFFLPTTWQRSLLMLSVLPVVLIKNGVRISVLTFLSIHVDQRILTGGFLHQSGGILFFLPALALMGAILWSLRR